MTRSRALRASCYAVILVALVFGAAEVFITGPDNASAVSRADAWVSLHAAALPTTLEEIAAYPQEYREAIRKALTPKQRSHLWREQLQGFLDTEPGLTAEQRAYVLELIGKLTPANITLASAGDQVVFDICERIPTLFPERQQQQVFSLLGATKSPRTSLDSLLVAFRERVGSTLSLLQPAYAEEGSQLCNCRGWGWCECTGSELCSGLSCQTHQGSGCGEDPSNCNGICIPEP